MKLQEEVAQDTAQSIAEEGITPCEIEVELPCTGGTNWTIRIAAYGWANFALVSAPPEAEVACREWVANELSNQFRKSSRLRKEWVARIASKGVQAVSLLLQASFDSDIEVRDKAEKAIVRLGSSAVPMLLRYLHNKNPSVRAKVVYLLWQIGDSSVLPDLAMMLSDTNPKVRQLAVHALGNIAGQQGIPLLTKAFADEDPQVRLAVIAEMRRHCMNDANVLFTLEKGFYDTDHEVRFCSVGGLVEVGVVAVPVLMRALRHEDRMVRWLSAQALGSIGDHRALPALIETLKDKDGDVRWSVIIAIGAFKDIRAVPMLMELVGDQDKWIAMIAVEMLGQIGDRRAVPILIDALGSADSGVRWVAAEALGVLKVKESVSELEKALQRESYGYVRQAIRKALAQIEGRE